MTQADVFDFLVENKGKRFTAKEIQLNLGIVEDRCFKNLKRLLNKDEIKKENHKYWIEDE